MASESGSRAVATGGSGLIGRTPLPAGRDASTVSLGAFPEPGYDPTYDLSTGPATVWPEFGPDSATEA